MASLSASCFRAARTQTSSRSLCYASGVLCLLGAVSLNQSHRHHKLKSTGRVACEIDYWLISPRSSSSATLLCYRLVVSLMAVSFTFWGACLCILVCSLFWDLTSFASWGSATNNNELSQVRPRKVTDHIAEITEFSYSRAQNSVHSPVVVPANIIAQCVLPRATRTDGALGRLADGGTFDTLPGRVR
jgi:hypothetical protein